MPYITLRLKTDDEETMLSALKSVFGEDEADNLIAASHNHFVSLIGTLYEPTGNILTDDEGIEYPEKVAVEGYHANVRTKLQSQADALASISIETDEPLVKFAGE